MTPINSTILSNTFANAATQTLSMQELCQEYMREHPDQADGVFADRLESRKCAAERMIEELRPLCEELPPDALDPVTMEPLDKPLVTACSHTFNWETIQELIKTHNESKEYLQKKGVPCPICKWEFSPKIHTFACASIGGMVEIFKKISEVFKKNVNS